ncbi:MAG: restriction endonuclease [Sideroxydans sp.]|nr:restriction endonuclease [Sideroxydans sp.]
MALPKYDGLFNPLLQALHNLGGSASISEQEDEVANILKLTDEEVSEIHRGNRTKFSYRLAWARNYLKRYGVIDNSSRGVWALTAKGKQINNLDKSEVKKVVQSFISTSKEIPNNIEKATDSDELRESEWEDDLLDVVKGISPDAFERLCQRLLRESGFIQVEVTGKSNDGGIDGKGVVRIGGLLSFHVIFQCKRYQGSVSSPVVRDFRGAMVGRADKGLLITTGTFTKDARIEAQRDGAPPIDLIDGEALAQKLKELRIGVQVKEKVVEEIFIDRAYFESV